MQNCIASLLEGIRARPSPSSRATPTTSAPSSCPASPAPPPPLPPAREPSVVPDFLAGLEAAGWVAVRAPAYTTCWARPGCAGPLVDTDAAAPDAVVFTSTAEVEGLDAAGWN